jgi:hypothetical protein
MSTPHKVSRGRYAVIKFLRENISFFNALLLVAGIFIALGRYSGNNEAIVASIKSTVEEIKTQNATAQSKIEAKVDTTIKQNADNGLAITLMQRDVKDVTNDVADMRKEMADMKEAQRVQADGLRELTIRVGVIENRANKSR